PSSQRFVVTPGQEPTINCIAQALEQSLPVLITGPPSSGKTSLVSHLCSLLHPAAGKSADLPVVTLQLGDHSSLDAKSLLGSYTSSSRKPGTFEWVEGALTRAVRYGKWLVLKDIDKATSEVLSVIKPLVEALGPYKTLGATPELSLGPRGKVKAGSSFRLFALRSTTPSKNRLGRSLFPPPSFLGNKHWISLFLPSLETSDVHEILAGTFVKLAAIADGEALSTLIEAWTSVVRTASGSGGQSKGRSAATRVPTLRDLIKWCRRVEAFADPTSSSHALFSDQRKVERAFVEGAEIFLGNLQSLVITTSTGVASPHPCLAALASALGLDAERGLWLLNEKTPDVAIRGGLAFSESDQATVRVGRMDLSRRKISSHASVSRTFAMTRPAAQLLERIAASVAMKEPVLLVGETGTGKTTTVQHLASLLGRDMIALNLSQQTEASDLLGSFKPVEPRIPATELHNAWFDLFETTFSSKRNARFVETERKALQGGKWPRLVTLWKESIRMAEERKDRKSKLVASSEGAEAAAAGTTTTKKRRTERGPTPGTPSEDQEHQREAVLNASWASFAERVHDFAAQHASKRRNFVFSFDEGPLVKALREGSWVLLDEINLAASETLDSLASVLNSPDSSVTLFERGDIEPIPRHPDFRLFACMNPATDVGKKDLPVNLRSRFTELYVQSPDSDREALIAIVEKYIGHLAASDRSAVMDAAECYTEIRKLANDHQLADGANQRPHYSIRTLARSLTFAADQCAAFGLRRALWEGFVMAFTMLLDDKSAKVVKEILDRSFIGRARNAKQAATFVPPRPKGSAEYVHVSPFWLQTGSQPLEAAEDYILTPSVQAKLVGLARAILARKSPVLIQGPTSAGKTSSVEYLARRTGHRFVRINNHEHTDIQEYLGSYASDPDSGRLVFHEGLLVKALRRGDWIVLDELNLAPTDVLEALNRLLDDNRELIIPETGEVVRPHPSFMLFATQNPPGVYAGRKVLSRAFRNRFLELHFDDVPRPELETILTNRCSIPPSYASKVVSVFVELQTRRQAGRVFDTKQAFVTLRDLFRWGQREATGYQQLAENGYMLIAERARRSDDKAIVKEVIEGIMNVKIDEASLYNLKGKGRKAASDHIGADVVEAIVSACDESGIVWTAAMSRLLCLVALALKYNEPVLLVGETGAGKTSACEIVAKAFGHRLHSVSCHQNTDTADLLGGQRPLRNRGALQAQARAQGLEVLAELADADNMPADDSDLETVAIAVSKAAQRTSDEIVKQRLASAIQQINQASALFEWRDGPLVEAMRGGEHLLLDEISLAEDSVLERLNSVLEPGRTLVLAEKSSVSTKSSEGLDAAQITAADGFEVVATMNPGGDYGKKELSPALRNRFTEIWVPQVDDREDILAIFEAKWADQAEALRDWGRRILEFADWYASQVGGKEQAGIGLRDLLAWVAFIRNAVVSGSLDASTAYAHGAMLAFVDGVGTTSSTMAMTTTGLKVLRQHCLEQIRSWTGGVSPIAEPVLAATPTTFGIGPFHIARGPLMDTSATFSFEASTSASNALKVLRALHIPNKAILLEGSPGAGKTSLIGALAAASGNALTRINLSDQTELGDLFGADLPVEGGGPGEFAWKDAAFLRAMQSGEWVLLDEMNLASQSVLEGLNSCLDHRGSVYIPELGRAFDKHPDFRLFAAQNPHQQGGGRKGLPKSFLNRFTKVFVEELRADDILAICKHLYPTFAHEELVKMIRFNAELHNEVMVKHSFGRQGAPWEFNLRDLLRWLAMIHSDLGLNWTHQPIDHLAALYIQRFRSKSDRQAAAALYESIFGTKVNPDARPWPTLSSRHVQFGHALLPRHPTGSTSDIDLAVLPGHLPALEALADCVRLQWMSILVGSSACGKTSLVRMLASFVGAPLEEVRMNSGVDTMDVLGTFEQMDPHGKTRQHLQAAKRLVGELKVGALRRLGAVYEQLAVAEDAIQQGLSALTGDRWADQHLQAVLKSLSAISSSNALSSEQSQAFVMLHDALASSDPTHQSAAGRFEWNDGPLLRAMKNGSWLLLDDANLCSASVLDRLNSLFEPGGALVLSERGVVDGEIPVVRPHANFRLFMAIDPQHGELSRAMRNRGLEISLPPLPTQDAALLSGLNAFSSTGAAPVLSSRYDTDLAMGELILYSSAEYSDVFEKFAFATLPSKSVGLFSRLATATSQDDIVQLQTFLRRVGVDHAATRPRVEWNQAHQDLEAFVAQQSLDLGVNPNCWDDKLERMPLFRLGLDVAASALHLLRLLHAARKAADSTSVTSGRSVLERYAMLALSDKRTKSHDGDDGREIGQILAFAGHAQKLTSQLVFSNEATPELLETLREMVRLLYFLVNSFSQQTAFDHSTAHIVMGQVQEYAGSLAALLPTAASSWPSMGHRSANLSSGHAMREIWELSMPALAFAEAAQGSSLLHVLLSKVQRSEHNAELVSSAVDLAATVRLSGNESWTASQKSDVLAMIDRVNRQLQAQPMLARGTTVTSSWEVPLLSAIQLHSGTFAGTVSDQSVCTELYKHSLTQAAYPVRCAIAARALDWSMQASSGRVAAASLEDSFLWTAPLLSQSHVDELLQPFLLHMALFPSTRSRINMSHLARHRKTTAKMGRLVMASRATTTSTRHRALRVELIAFVKLLATKLGSSAHDEVCAAVPQLQGALDALSGASEDDVAATGQAYLDVASEMLRLYVPNVPLDPLALMRTGESLARSKLDGLVEHEVIWTNFEKQVTGHISSPMATSIQEAVKKTTEEWRSTQSKTAVDRRPDATRLAQLFRTVASVVSQTISKDRVSDLRNLIAAGGLQDQVIAREDHLQRSLQSLRRALVEEYTDLADLCSPIVKIVDLFQVGFRALLWSEQHRHAPAKQQRHAKLVDALVAFPTTRACEAFLASELPVRVKAGSSEGSLAVPMLLTVLSSVSCEVQNGRTLPAVLKILSRTYDQLFFIWTTDREHERKAAEEQSSLFKSRNNVDADIPDDEELLEAEFRSMFPEYGDIMDRDEQNAADQGSASGSKGLFFAPEYQKQLWELHCELFAATQQEGRLDSTALNRMRLQLARSLMTSSYGSAMCEDLDKKSGAFQLHVLAREAGLDDGSSHRNAAEVNFYLDANVDETSKATNIVEAMRARLSELVEEWPEQMVLQHIRDRCDAILALDSASPVAKVLSALEQLLVHSQDWEGYANSSNSLAAHRTRISDQIIAWRRLELSSWAKLLETQAQDYKASVSIWWFRIYEVAVRGMQSAVADGAAAEHLRSLVSLLDEFVRSSTLGDFAARLDLVRAFGGFLDLLFVHAPSTETEGLDRVGRIFANVVAFYGQFSATIAETLDRQRNKIEKDIRDFIKLASWKDVNIHALKQSAQKSHRRLHKSTRQFRDVLRQPVDPILAGASEIRKQAEDLTVPAQRSLSHGVFDVSMVSKTLAQLPAGPQGDAERPRHLVNLARTLEILAKKTDGHLLPALSAVHHEAIDGLATVIVSESQNFAKATPALAKEDNEKTIKDLTNQKRKAWTDLLKELRRIGFTPFVNADVASHNQDLAAVYERRLLEPAEKDLNSYYYRLLALLPRMRQSLHTANGDIPIQELQRGVSYCEHAMSIVFKERARLAKLHDSRAKLQATVARLSVLGSDAVAVPCPAHLSAHVDALGALSRRASAALREIHCESAVNIQLSPFKMAGLQSFRDGLADEMSLLSSNADKLAKLSCALNGSCSAFWTKAEHELVKQSFSDLERIAGKLERAEAAVKALCVPTSQWLTSQLAALPATSSHQPQSNGAGGDPASLSDRLIGSVLVIAQDVQQLATPATEQGDHLPDKTIVEDWQMLQAAERQLRHDEVADCIAGCLSSIATSPGSSGLNELPRISPFVANYSRLLSAHIDASRSWQRSILKLTYLLSSLVASLALYGFCKPPAQDTSEDAEAGTDSQDLEGGTGLGDGSGAQDITDQVDDDENIEELEKGDDAEGEKGETQREKGAKEAQEDIGGDLEDISADEGDDGAEEEDKDDGEQEDPDEHVGDVDPLDPNAVDEKVWSGEQDEEQKQGDDKDETNKDLDGGKEGQEDSVAKDEGKRDDKAQKESASDRKEGGEQQQDGEDSEGEEGDEGQPEDDGEGEELAPEEDDGQEQQGPGRKLDEQVDDSEKLDIDEDIKMSDQEGGDDDEDDDEVDNLSDIDLPEEGQQQDAKGGQEDDLPADAPEELEKLNDQGEQQQQGDEAADEEAEVAKNAGEDAMDADDLQDEEGEEQDDLPRAQGQDGAAMDQEQDAMLDDADPAGDSQAAGDIPASAEQAQGSAGQQGRQARQSRPTAPQGQSDNKEAAERDEQQTGDQEQAVDDPSASAARGARADTQAQDEQQTAAEEGAEEEDNKANPIRSLGDALKEFRRNLDSIAEATADETSKPEAKPEGEAMPEDGEVEHIANDNDAEMQALGAAEDEEIAQKMPEKSVQDAEQEGDAKPAAQEEDVAMQEPLGHLEPAPLPNVDEGMQQQQEQSRSDDSQRQQQPGGALMPNDIDRQARQLGVDEERESSPSIGQVDGEAEEEQVDPLPEDERQQADEALESALADFRDLSTDEERLAKAGELWRSYTAMTSDLAFALCEQLRLILTPTLAARLNGDFRTGKRLNMRKIVPFIASDFAKDKIWLRRTKPSKREYQVLLALDDSRSMADNHSVHLAYQTLALVTGALSRLEVGDVSICRFGESVRTLHPFGHGQFGEDSGSSVLQQLSFEQRGTNVARLLEHTLESLQEARDSRGTSSGSSAADLWQLEIIISDGVCQDHEKLRSLLRRASEQRVMIVFIIVDSMRGGGDQQGKSSSSASSSILSMSSVKYEVDPATGKMEIKMDRYLDSFPFSYYVVLREAEALPEVLATTLRQWAEKIREAE
ncbi:P-loop containing nucleoside triphosphate hydrolase protein, partial [Jaminaea rosea]